MVKFANNRIDVRTDGRGRPLIFSAVAGKSFRKADYRVVRILSWWREPAQWWEGEPVKLYLLLEAAPVGGKASAGLYEICRAGEEWYFHRLIG